MTTIDLNLVRSFVAVHEAGSFSRAAERLGVPRSTVSRAIATLEESLGVRLFHRTTRNVSVTTAGTVLHDRVAPLMTALEGSLADLPEREKVPSGLLRVTSTVDLGTTVLAEAVARFTHRYPATQVDVHLSNNMVDLVRDGFDLALRVSGRPLRDSSLVARKVGVIVIQLFASPAYLARKGVPRSPEDLKSHDWVGFRPSVKMVLVGPTSEAVVDQRPRITVEDMSFMRALLKAGGGVGALPSFLADEAVAAGTLVRVMPRWVAHTGGVYLVHPSRKHLPRKVTAFGDLVTELLRQRPLWAPSPGEVVSPSQAAAVL